MKDVTFRRPDPTGVIPLFVRVGEHVLAVGHGIDPVWLAAELGAPAARGATPRTDHGPVDEAGNRPLVLDFTDGHDPADLPAPSPPGMVVPDEAQVRRQRVATHAVVLDPAGERVLMTGYLDELSDTEFWNLPGGGVDPGETFEQAIAREVWEETGHDLLDAVPMGVRSWTGQGWRRDVVEDFHGISLVWAARVAVATEPVVHDVGGTTTQAAWVSLDDPRIAERVERNAQDLRRAVDLLG